MRLSILIPVYNEQSTVSLLLKRIKQSELPPGVTREIIVVDDGSTDQTNQILSSDESIKIYRQPHQGKGAAIKLALTHANGGYCLTQDADLEYDPQEISKLLHPVLVKKTKVVYGSRNLKINPRSSLAFFWGGVFLTKLINILYHARLTDESTGYKLIQTKLFRSLKFNAQGFEFCPEITVKILKKGIPITEIPISYSPRDFQAGKKIRVWDGVLAVWTILKYRFIN